MCPPRERRERTPITGIFGCCACRGRPHDRRAAQRRDELAPFHHSISLSAPASSVGGASRPSDLAVFAFMTSSYLVDACTGRPTGFSPLSMRSMLPGWYQVVPNSLFRRLQSAIIWARVRTTFCSTQHRIRGFVTALKGPDPSVMERQGPWLDLRFCRSCGGPLGGVERALTHSSTHEIHERQ